PPQLRSGGGVSKAHAAPAPRSSGQAGGQPGNGRGGGRAGRRPKRGGPWCGANRRSQSAERSAASCTPPGKTYAPGRKPWAWQRCSSSRRKPPAGSGGSGGAAGLGRVQPAASTTVAARRQPLAPGRREPLMAGGGSSCGARRPRLGAGRAGDQGPGGGAKRRRPAGRRWGRARDAGTRGGRARGGAGGAGRDLAVPGASPARGEPASPLPASLPLPAGLS
uniref:Uncharacterized protein n=1 Tax=Canis lupus familiaris TaxID=9615 RepID=A0A8P0TRC3_CANLF